MTNVALVIVTFNRLEKLRKTLSHYDNQTESFKSLIVVNNASTDGSLEFLDEWQQESSSYDRYVIHLEENLGGSGGFYEGQKFALTLNPDWIYLADDDAYADREMIAEFYKFIEEHDTDNISAICATVLNADGTIAYEHRSRVEFRHHLKFLRKSSVSEDYNKDNFSIDLLSYVGSFLNVKTILKVGLVDHRYFIYSDDSEHSFRLKQCGDIVCVPKMKVLHDSGQNTMTEDDNVVVSWRDYYAIRNMLYMILQYNVFAAIYSSMANIRRAYLSSNKNLEKRALIVAAVRDAWLGRLGKHKLYRPGWQINKQ